MKNTNFEYTKTNLNIIHNINHITQQKTNNITREMVGFTSKSNDKLIRHNPAATTEWDNSGYSYINGESQVSAVIDQSTYELVRLFFNSRPKNLDSSKSTMFRHRSILKTFIGRPRVKSSLNRARITIYKYNRQKVYYMNMLKKSFMLCPNKKGKRHSVNSKIVKAPCKKLVTTIFNPSFYSFFYSKNNLKNTNIALPKLGRKKDVFPSLGREKKGIRTYSSYAVPFSSKYKKETNVRYLSQKVIKPAVNNSNIRKVPSVSCNSNITLPTIKNNNLPIIRSGEKKSCFSGAPNLIITRSNSKKSIVNPNYGHGMNKLEQDIKKLHKNVERIKNKLGRKGETNITLDSKNNKKILYVKLGHNKNTDSKKIIEFSKHPFNKKVPGKFKRVNKGISLFTPKCYTINKIRYLYPTVTRKDSLSLAKNRKTNKKIINSKRPVQKSRNISTLDKKKRGSIIYKKRISRWIQRKLQKKVQKGKKRIFFNILRNKTFQLVLSTLKYSFKSKPSILVLKRIENYSMNFFFKVKSLKLFLFNYANKGTYKCAPFFVLTIWNKLRNTTNSPLSTLLLTKKVANKRVNISSKSKANKIIIPSLNLGKLIGKFYKRIFASKFYYTILWVYYMKSNNLYLSRLNHILKKRYGKKITLNIVDLKYIYLDSNIMAEAITTKLKDRKKRVLRVLKRALGLIKKPYFKIHFYNKKKTLEQLNVNFLLMDKKLNMSTYSLNNNILLNKYLFKKPSHYKSRLLLFHLKHKIISGVRLEGSGRLTRRLTASRSISKFKYMGSLQNIESSRQALSTVMLRGYMKSNLQYMNINSYNRNGAFGVKVSVSSY